MAGAGVMQLASEVLLDLKQNILKKCNTGEINSCSKCIHWFEPLGSSNQSRGKIISTVHVKIV